MEIDLKEMEGGFSLVIVKPRDCGSKEDEPSYHLVCVAEDYSTPPLRTWEPFSKSIEAAAKF